MTYTDADRAFLESRQFPVFGTEFGKSVEHMPLPESISVNVGLRAAYFFVEQYLALEKDPVDEMVLLWAYLTGDPAVIADWENSVRRAVDSLGQTSQSQGEIPDH